MKLAIIVGAAFVVGLGGGTAMGMRAAPAVPADSLARKSLVAAPPKLPAVVRDSVAAAAEAPKDSTVVPPVTAPAAEVPPPSGVVDTAAMAASFSKLAPTEAAPLAARLSDGELEAVLRKMSVDKSAAIIAALPKPRGQAISKKLLATRVGA